MFLRPQLGALFAAALSIVISAQGQAHASSATAMPVDSVVRLLAELTNAHGAPGFEGPLRNILRREWQRLLSDMRTDGLGNLLGSADDPRVLISPSEGEPARVRQPWR
jgi:hypothetical protein